MDDTTNLDSVLNESVKLHNAWREALDQLSGDGSLEVELRIALTIDSGSLTLQHGQALRVLMTSGLPTSALALMRVQHEALLRAVWLLFAASENDVQRLAAPLTPGAMKRADGPMAGVMLDAVEKSGAPAELKRALREFREESWAGANSYTHAGILALGREVSGHLEVSLVQAVQVSNAHGYAACMLLAALLAPEDGQGVINAIAIEHPHCMTRLAR